MPKPGPALFEAMSAISVAVDEVLRLSSLWEEELTASLSGRPDADRKSTILYEKLQAAFQEQAAAMKAMVAAFHDEKSWIPDDQAKPTPIAHARASADEAAEAGRAAAEADDLEEARRQGQKAREANARHVEAMAELAGWQEQVALSMKAKVGEQE